IADLHGVSAPSISDAWAVGLYGTILHYTGGAWQQVPTGFTNALYDVQMLSAGDGSAVGSQIIAHWNGSSWAQVATPANILYGLSLVDSGEGWAVGAGGVIWHESGGTWTVAPSPAPPTTTLYSVAM